MGARAAQCNPFSRVYAGMRARAAQCNAINTVALFWGVVKKAPDVTREAVPCKETDFPRPRRCRHDYWTDGPRCPEVSPEVFGAAGWRGGLGRIGAADSVARAVAGGAAADHESVGGGHAGALHLRGQREPLAG